MATSAMNWNVSDRYLVSFNSIASRNDPFGVSTGWSAIVVMKTFPVSVVAYLSTLFGAMPS